MFPVLPPLIARLAADPRLLADHATAYLALSAALTAQKVGVVQRRALWWLLLALLLLLGLALTGAALLLFAALPLAAMPMPWLLLVVPGVPLLAAAGCGAWLYRLSRLPEADTWLPLRAQWAADVALLREAAP